MIEVDLWLRRVNFDDPTFFLLSLFEQLRPKWVILWVTILTMSHTCIDKPLSSSTFWMVASLSCRISDLIGIEIFIFFFLLKYNIYNIVYIYIIWYNLLYLLLHIRVSWSVTSWSSSIFLSLQINNLTLSRVDITL